MFKKCFLVSLVYVQLVHDLSVGMSMGSNLP